jgi:hypothetical protein
LFFTRIKNIPHGKKNINYKNDTTCYKKSYTHDDLLCRITNANNNIVPGQCAEYSASSLLPNKPKVIEYNIQINANITGYHFRTNAFIFFDLIIFIKLIKKK